MVANGVSPVFAPRGGPTKRKGTGAPFALCVAQHRPHKNLALALRALARLPRREGWELVVVGASERDVQSLASALGCRSVLPRLRVHPYVSDTDLRDLYTLAQVVLVPSLIEGFALPAWEARACGAPVLVLDRPWSDDLVELGVTRIRSENPSVWARQILRSASAARTVPSAGLIPSWDDTASRMLDVLAQTAARFRPRET